MPKICYTPKKFGTAKLEIIDTVNSIIDEYNKLGIQLTVRQIYYQFVARDIIANNMKEYKNLAGTINDGRMAGLIDWMAIQDRTRELRKMSHWPEPASIIEAGAEQYREDVWDSQKVRMEVWIEKDAGIGNIEAVCQKWRIPFFSCRGYTSQSEMWVAGQRFLKHMRSKQGVYILHLGDHDPSGIDMSRDIEDRLKLFLTRESIHYANALTIDRIALNADQVEEYNPPPNPAKLTDSRAKSYIEQFGNNSWELDALDPRTVQTLIEENVQEIIDLESYEEAVQAEESKKKELTDIAQNYSEVVRHLNDNENDI